MRSKLESIEELTKEVFSHWQFEAGDKIEMILANFSRYLMYLFNFQSILTDDEFNHYYMLLMSLGRTLMNLALD